MTSCQYKQSTEQYALFKNKVALFKDFSQKLILRVLSNLFRTLRTHCIFTCLSSMKASCFLEINPSETVHFDAINHWGVFLQQLFFWFLGRQQFNFRQVCFLRNVLLSYRLHLSLLRLTVNNLKQWFEIVIDNNLILPNLFKSLLPHLKTWILT
jgi:hypothetical protein